MYESIVIDGMYHSRAHILQAQIEAGGEGLRVRTVLSDGTSVLITGPHAGLLWAWLNADPEATPRLQTQVAQLRKDVDQLRAALAVRILRDVLDLNPDLGKPGEAR